LKILEVRLYNTLGLIIINVVKPYEPTRSKRDRDDNSLEFGEPKAAPTDEVKQNHGFNKMVPMVMSKIYNGNIMLI
jgi:hypothetical protein